MEYDKFAVYCGISCEESNDYFKFLRKYNLVIEKQLCLCPNCKEECAIDTSLNEEEFECEECESSFKLAPLRRHSTILYKLNEEYIKMDEVRIKSDSTEEYSNIVDISKIRADNKLNERGKNSMERKLKVFLSYSHENEDMKKKLSNALIMLKRNEKIETWDDSCILAGSTLDESISRELESADIIVLLVSTDFLVSEYCFSIEMKRALERHKNNEAVVIPVILKPCDWLNSKLKKLKCIPKDGKPISKYEDQDDAYEVVRKEIQSVIEAYDIVNQ
ncbi:toll/interleukin-1 receptor domain-containing protein [Clostridium gasigenes]|uniref:TIR domain-containing protein n=1 Tax=Clostridium gasigenes TaxID=94869 RepID=A0A1H0VDH9_9CLOT|nr:toll/interleukin-1 receptor domain-containing protein [Clostridium gasigenes]SDP76146.1 TIR domain-containing protein [Clostridium gasigenes]